jgi:hypothetical protein
MALTAGIKSATGTTALPPVSIPSYRRPNGHPLGSVFRQKQSGTDSIHCPKFFSNSVFLAEDVFLSIFFPTQPAPFKTGVIPAVLPVKGLR